MNSILLHPFAPIQPHGQPNIIVPFAGITRSFTSFSQAAAENGESRIYVGLHFRTAVEDGINQGKKIGHYVFTHGLQPLKP